MIKTKNTYRFFALIMAGLMFFTSIGFAVDIHYCQGQLKTISLFGEAKNCHELAQTSGCKHHQKTTEDSTCAMDEKDCCQNKSFLFQADLDKQIQQANLVSQDHFPTAFIFPLTSNITSRLIAKDLPVYAKYKPPLIPKDIPVLLQTFIL